MHRATRLRYTPTVEATIILPIRTVMASHHSRAMLRKRVRRVNADRLTTTGPKRIMRCPCTRQTGSGKSYNKRMRP